ncbi:MAG: histidine kinase [Firmicutes bacterium]|nr:histidine kinase [Bacillota bacterium]
MGMTERDTTRLRELFDLLNDGIIVMDKARIIVFMNPSATRITGWVTGDIIPYCTFCQARSVGPGEERCFLASQPEQSYFESEFLTKMGTLVPVGMNRTFLSSGEQENGRDMVITIRDVTVERQAKELALRAELSHHMLAAQEEERKRLSQELHDGISQTLYGISLGLDHLQSLIPSHGERIAALHGQVQRCAAEVRAMSRDLYPAVLYDLGLTAAIRTLAEQLTTPARSVQVQIDELWWQSENALSSTHIYRIIQESLHNAILHGHATKIVISLEGSHQGRIRISDNGTGFLVPVISESSGYGLRNMNERAQALGGVLRIESKTGAGTTVEVEFPGTAGAPIR